MKDQFEKTVAVEMRLHESVLGWHGGAYTNQYTQCLFKGFCVAYQHQQSKIDDLQKRVDAVNGLIEDLNKCYQQDHQNKFEYWRGFADSAGILGKRLEQALKGGGE